jgi:glycosyltransferase involved in cell wall biosynthesis
MNNPKVYFMMSRYMGCNYVRGLLPMWFNGWNGNVIGMADRVKDAALVKQEVMNADIVVFHRPEKPEFHEVAWLLKKMGKKIVFENDDTFILDGDHPFKNRDEWGILKDVKYKNDLLHNFITNSDLVTTTTEWLADEYRQFNKNVVVIPNYINPKDWPEPLRNEGDKVRIGITGSVSYSQDFKPIENELRELDKNPNVQLVMLGLHSKKIRQKNPMSEETYKVEYDFFDSLENLEHTPWADMIDYMDTLNELKLDIMLIPRKDCYFNRAKSNIKYLEAAMLEIPVIAQSFPDGLSPYDKDIDGTNGILVPVGGDWMTPIMELVNNKEKRREMGKKAHEYALQHYNINDHYLEWRDAYLTLMEQK